MEDCIFCKIIKGDIPSIKVYEDDETFAFLDIMPIKDGHTLVIPKNHDRNLFEMNESGYSKLLLSAKQIAEKLKKAFNPKTGKVGMVVYGVDVDHAHIHLVPIDKSGDLDFKNKKPASKEALEKALDKINSAK